MISSFWLRATHADVLSSRRGFVSDIMDLAPSIRVSQVERKVLEAFHHSRRGDDGRASERAGGGHPTPERQINRTAQGCGGPI